MHEQTITIIITSEQINLVLDSSIFDSFSLGWLYIFMRLFCNETLTMQHHVVGMKNAQSDWKVEAVRGFAVFEQQRNSKNN